VLNPLCEYLPLVFRAAAQRQELQAAVDQLPEAGAEARHVLPRGRGDRHEPPRQARQQVSTARTFSQLSIHLLASITR
jgi:hypothetical protein